jgi:hypothetical protein
MSGEYNVDILVDLLEVSTGKTSIYRDKITMEAELDGNYYPVLYIWEEGNYSCDCNRRSFFYGRFVEDSPCGEGKYLIKISNADTGEVYYDETGAE